jgi:hypothetical protein
VGTAKRERKKANRQLRLEQLEKQRRQQKAKRRGLQIGIAVPLLVGILVLVVWAVNSSGSKSSSATTTTAVVDTTDVTGATDTVAESTVPGSTVAPLDCPKDDGSSVHEQQFPSAPGLCIDPTKVYVATVTTNKGEFTVELDPGIAPKTVNNFVYLANYHYFDGTKCHRIIPGFVVQCGDPTATGSGGPGYSFADELPTAGSYKLGSLAMANSGPNTNGSQFFIITGPNGVALNPLYSLFGQVTAGFDTTVKAMEAEGTEGAGTPKSDVIIEKVVINVKAGATATATTTTAAPAATTAPATTAAN